MAPVIHSSFNIIFGGDTKSDPTSYPKHLLSGIISNNLLSSAFSQTNNYSTTEWKTHRQTTATNSSHISKFGYLRKWRWSSRWAQDRPGWFAVQSAAAATVKQQKELGWQIGLVRQDMYKSDLLTYYSLSNENIYNVKRRFVIFGSSLSLKLKIFNLRLTVCLSFNYSGSPAPCSHPTGPDKDLVSTTNWWMA